jgi:hypothetical protein
MEPPLPRRGAPEAASFAFGSEATTKAATPLPPPRQLNQPLNHSVGSPLPPRPHAAPLAALPPFSPPLPSNPLGLALPPSVSPSPPPPALCWAGHIREALRTPGFAWIECCAACALRASPRASPCRHPPAARFALLATPRHGLCVLAPGISSRAWAREAAAAVEVCGSGRAGFSRSGEGGSAPEGSIRRIPTQAGTADAAVAQLRRGLGEARVRDLRALGPLYIPSGYEDDFNFPRHVLARMAARCLSAERLDALLATAAAALRTFRETVEESYRPGDLRRCRAVDIDGERVYAFDPRDIPSL